MALQWTVGQKHKKKGTIGKKFGVFSCRYSENYILSRKFNPKMEKSGPFISPKSGHFFSIFLFSSPLHCPPGNIVKIL